MLESSKIPPALPISGEIKIQKKKEKKGGKAYRYFRAQSLVENAEMPLSEYPWHRAEFRSHRNKHAATEKNLENTRRILCCMLTVGYIFRARPGMKNSRGELFGGGFRFRERGIRSAWINPF
jgi:hypothetical protein